MIEIIKIIWKPVIEIIILAIVIYYLIGFLRRTRGLPIVIGFVILLILTIIATLFEFQVLAWLLQAFFAISAFAIVVILQPELRRLLAEIGSIPMITNTHEQRHSIEEIIKAVENMSASRIGALIAIENTHSLYEYVQNPVVVDCEITTEMLESIFFPNNVLHDGAVIIKGDRIMYAACILPLTRREDLSKSLGTRHRAAIGLSEETDAVVIIVSEETGQISYAFKGELIRNVTIEQLRDYLTSKFVKPNKTNSIVRWLRIKINNLIGTVRKHGEKLLIR
ncbi:MAG TPA: diadenylate cyclase CdaA [Verrucomicrobiota bacterium]|nr:diadenylate cyclase CdaA [Verrucomicrobiota bacterium]